MDIKCRLILFAPEWLNTLDNDKPSSAVIPLTSTQKTSSFNVEWSGSDQGAGIKDYTIWVSEDDAEGTAPSDADDIYLRYFAIGDSAATPDLT